MTTQLKITKIDAKDLQGAITDLKNQALNVTLSLAFYTTIDGNCQPLKGLPKDVTGDLDRHTKKFVCAKWDKDLGEWIYSKAKAEKLCKELGLVFSKTTFEEFIDAVQKAGAVPEVVLSADEQADKDNKSGRRAVKRAVDLLIKAGLTQEQMQAVFLNEIAMPRSEKPAKQSEVTAQ